MNLFDIPKRFLKGTLSKGSIIGAVGGAAASAVLKRKRKRWQKSEGAKLDAVLDLMTPYEMGRGAGRLLAGWLQYQHPALDTAFAEQRFMALLKDMDEQDTLPEDRALSRFLVSKALFQLEGFRMGVCSYERFQKDSLALLRKNPKWKKLTRRDVFLGLPFEPDALIGPTHRLLILLSGGQPTVYLDDVIEYGELRNDADYMKRLLALTYGVAPEALEDVIYGWFEEYRRFKIDQSHRHEALIQTSLSAVTGGLPAMAGLGALGGAWKILAKKKKD